MYSGRERTHEQARSVICCCCGCKDFRSQPITEGLEQVVRQEIFSGYNRNDEYLPNGLCGSCRTYLFASKRGNPVPTTVRDKWNSMNFEEYRAPSRSTPCSCRICKIVRHKGKRLETTDRLDVPQSTPPYDEKQAYLSNLNCVWT